MLSRLFRATSVALMVLAIAALASSGAQGQAPGSVLINFVELVEQDAQQVLRVFFTMLGPDRRVITGVAPETAAIDLSAGEVVGDVTLFQPRNPLYITLVLDASGSVSGQTDVIRAAAIEAINTAPPEARIAVLQFNEQINLLQNFTENRDAAIAAVNAYQSANSGTCLYDATYQAVQLLENAEPASRRSVILFTDGRDERTAGQGDTCSQHTFDEVIALATRNSQRTPIYTIGLQGNAPINAIELQNMADLTGGISQVGSLDRLSQLFQEIMAALRSQWVAEVAVCVPRGDNRTVTMSVEAGNQAFMPSAAVFSVPEGCVLPTATPTATATATPRPLVLFIQAFRFDELTESASFEIERQGDGDIARFRVQIIDSDRGVNLLDFMVDSQDVISQQVAFETTNIRNGPIDIAVAALNQSGITIARETRRVAVQRATPTASRTPVPTATPVPVAVIMESLTYSPETDQINLGLSFRQPQQIQEFRIDLIDEATSITSRQFRPGMADSIPLDVSGLVPNNTYIVRVIAETTGGGRVMAESEFIYDPDYTPTPTATATATATFTPTDTPTITATPTLPPVIVDIVNLAYDRASDRITIELDLQQEQRIGEFRVNITRSQTREHVRTFEPEIAEQIVLDVSDLDPGQEYLVQVLAESDSGLLRPQEVFTYDPILTPTPTPTETATPTPTATATLVPAVEIAGIQLDASEESLIIEVRPQNTDLIARYGVRLKTTGGIEIDAIRVDAPPYDVVRMPLQSLANGDYDLELNAFNTAGTVIASHTLRVGIARVPTPTPTPPPGFPASVVGPIVDTARENPIVFGVIALLFVLLVGVLVWMVRRATGSSRATYLPPNPGATQILTLPKSGPGAAPALAAEATMVDIAGDYTIVDYAEDLPRGITAQLVVTRSENPALINKRAAITTREFTIGRERADLTLEAGRVSKHHATIVFKDGKFFIRDEGSSGGTMVNNQRAEPNQLVPLPDGATVLLGSGGRNELRFSVSEPTAAIDLSESS